MQARTFSHVLSLSSLGLCLGLAGLVSGCKGGDDGGLEGAGSETAGTDDTSTGDGDGDTTGDGDGDTTGDGDGDGDTGGCGALGCECSGDTCNPGLACIDGTCQETACGDGEVQGDEECEDGNNVDGDGCDNDCTLTRVAQVAAGQHHTCVVIDGGAVRCWGRGEFGQLGHGTTENIGDDEFPSDVGDVPLPGPVARLALGGHQSCGMFEDSSLRCWGLNDRGQLGYGNIDNLGDDEALENLGAITVQPVIEVGLGNRHTCARVGSGQVQCWGLNEQGQLGYGNTMDMIPVLEMLLPGGTLSLGGNASGLALGWNHSCVRFIDGGMRCWGRNDNGQLGLGNLDNVGDNELPSDVGTVALIPAALPPNTEIIEIALGGSHSCARLSNGQVRCWGANGSGQLGLGNLNTLGDDESPNAGTAVALDGAAVQVVAGANHTCAMLAGGSVTCWGDAAVGQLGYGNIDNIGDDEPANASGTVELGGSAVQLAAGGNHTCALLENGDLLCWGQNTFSQLGLGSSVTVGDNETPADAGPVSVF